LSPETSAKPRKKKPAVVWTDTDRADAWAWMTAQLKAGIKPELTRVSLVEWAETHRVIPQGLSPMPGLFSWAVTPYLEEIAENLSETSPVQYVAVLKGAQVGFSVGVGENWILYTIDQAPGPMLYVGQTQQAVEKIMEERIGPAIHESGLDHKIFAQAKSKGSRMTGNTNSSKQFPGGRLHAIGPNMGSRIRSDSFQKGYLDEMDAWQQEIGSAEGKRKSEGSTLKTIERRFDTFETTLKILYGSTPLEASSSLIEPMYEMGDQRKFHVPCKYCGELQPVEWEQLKYEADERGVLIYDSVHYECIKCGGHWKNQDKVEFLKTERWGGKARWVPTAEPRRRGMRSYHLPSLLSPIGFRSWESICEESLEAGKDPTKLQAFWNTVLGRTWQATGFTPDYTKVMIRREDYALGSWPDRAILVTVGIDTQDDRIEAEVVAWGRNKESWSLGYYIFHGDTAVDTSPAWAQLADLMGQDFGGHKIALALMDSQGHRTTEVYNFAESFLSDRGQLIPCAGDAPKNRTKMFALYPLTGFAVRRADLQVDKLKEELYGFLNQSMPDEGLVPRGYCHFPQEYGEKYFRGLTSEERVKERQRNGGTRTIWRKIKGRGRNEPLDCRVYAMGALYVFKHLLLEESADEALPWEVFWDWCEANLA